MPKKAKPNKAKPKPAPRKPKAAADTEVLDLKAAADFLKVSKPTFYRWLAQEKIIGFKAGQQWRFYRSDLEKFLQAEEPSALKVDTEQLRHAVEEAREARGLPRVEWPDTQTPEESSVIGAVNSIIRDAIDARASDIHMDNNQDDTLIRYRIDGVLTEVMRLPRKVSLPLVSRLKLMGDMDVAERRTPQNGRIHLSHRDREFDLRLTTVPAVFGESAVLRILDQTSVLIGLGKLGLSDAVRETFERLLHAPWGLLIVTGPSGSGRTTTIYSALSLLNSPKAKVISVEDPVEYRLRDTMQVNVNRKMGLTFPAAIRSFVRCDPDILMVGELRDLETAELCANAATTGHLVLTTMLPSDAPSVITRLIEMGVEPFMIGASVIGVLAQRLVRRVCADCKAQYHPSSDALRRMGMTDEEIAAAKFHRGAGCDTCNHTGYRGRTAIFELLEVRDGLRELIARPVTTVELRVAAVDAGMTTLLRDGLEKAKKGVTTVEEVLRVVGRS